MESTQNRLKASFLEALKKWAVQQGLSAEDAEDVLQEGRIKYFQRRGVDYMDDPNPQPSFLKKIVADEIANCFRRQSRRFRAEQQFASAQDGELDEDAIVNILLGKEILERLPPKWRWVAIWRYEHKLSWREISGRLGVPVGTLSVQFQRALFKVCQEMGIQCRKIALSGGINSEGTNRASLQRRMSHVESEDAQNDGCCADSCKYHDSATHLLHTRRSRRGGGGVTQDRYGATATCSGGKIPLEESSVRQLLDANARTDEQQGHTVYAGTYVIQPLRLIACPDQFCEREETTKWSCRELKCRGQDADYVNTKHWRNKIIWKCSGSVATEANMFGAMVGDQNTALAVPERMKSPATVESRVRYCVSVEVFPPSDNNC